MAALEAHQDDEGRYVITDPDCSTAFLVSTVTIDLNQVQ